MPGVNLVHRVGKALGEAGVAPGSRLVVAVSGGVDSMVLLDALGRLPGAARLRLHVVHVHHGLRGAAADADAAFVAGEAARRALPVSVVRLDPAARRRGESIETWAREARYGCLEAMGGRVKAARILVAHTRDDQAETLLLNLLRGTGPRGLAGIPASRDRILRPLLSVTRREVEAYAARHHVRHREDASNGSDAYRRNRIRRHLLPLLAKTYNPRIVESLASLAALVREDDAALTDAALRLTARTLRRVGADVSLRVAPLFSAPPAVARRAFQEAFRLARGPAGHLTRRHLEALCALLGREGQAALPGGLVARRAGGEIRIGSAGGARGARAVAERGSQPKPQAPVPLRLGRWARWPPLDCAVRVRRLSDGSRAAADRWRAVLSPTLLDMPLRLRGWLPGDRFRPRGGAGRKKLQDFFVDAKIPRPARGRVPLLVAGGEIAWVVGQRLAEPFGWSGRGAACLVEVRFPEGAHGLSTGTHADQRS